MERMLRVSVVREGRMVDDRYVPPDGLVAAGVRSALVALPAGALPAGHRLFEHRDGRPVLRVPDGLAGQVACDGRRVEALAPGEVELGPDARGFVDLGEAKVFFQVAPRPAAVPKSALPKDMRSKLKSLDRRYAFALALALACEAVALWQVSRIPAVTPEGEPVDPYAGIFHPIPRFPAPKPPDPPKPQVAEAKPKPGKAAPKAPAAAQAAPNQVDREAIRRMPIFVALASAGGATADAFNAKAQPDLLAALTGVKPVNPFAGPVPPGHRASQYENKGPQEIGDPGIQMPGHDDPTLRDKTPAKLPDIQIAFPTDPEDPPPVDDPGLAARIRKEIMARGGALQACYERELKLHRDLRGKVVLEFVLGTDGKVSEVEIDDETLNGPETAACMASLAKNWRLAVRPKEETPVHFPIVFAPGN